MNEQNSVEIELEDTVEVDETGEEKTVLQVIEDLIVSCELDDENSVFKLTSWPYARKIVAIICSDRGIDFKYERLNKTYDQFTVSGCSNIEEVVKKVISKVNSTAKAIASEEGSSLSAERNDLVRSLQEMLSIGSETFDVFKTQRAPKKSKKDPIVAEASATDIDLDEDDSEIDLEEVEEAA